MCRSGSGASPRSLGLPLLGHALRLSIPAGALSRRARGLLSISNWMEYLVTRLGMAGPRVVTAESNREVRIRPSERGRGSGDDRREGRQLGGRLIFEIGRDLEDGMVGAGLGGGFERQLDRVERAGSLRVG